MTAPRSIAGLAAEGFSPLRWAQLPGAPLRLVEDREGYRWHLAGCPVSVGVALELLVISAREPCPLCWGAGEDGRVPGPDGELIPCSTCGGSEAWARWSWLPVRFEIQGRGAGSGVVYLYLDIPGLGGAEKHHAVELWEGDDARLRWPRGNQ